MFTSNPLVASMHSAAVWCNFPLLWSVLCNPKKKNCFLSFGYPDFKISPVSCQIETGIGLCVSDMSEGWLIPATHHFEGYKINSLSLCQYSWKEWEKVTETYISLLIMLTSIRYVKIFDSRFCKEQSQFSLVSSAAAWSSWQAPI